MYKLSLGTMALALVALSPQAQAEPKKVECVPNGTAFQVLGCAYNANVDKWHELNTHYSEYLDSIFTKCEKDNTGGGSGGFDDRISCVTKALAAEAARVNLKK
jgi:hypothetical protein